MVFHSSIFLSTLDPSIMVLLTVKPLRRVTVLDVVHVDAAFVCQIVDGVTHLFKKYYTNSP